MKKRGVYGAFGTLLIMIVVVFIVSLIFGPKILKSAKALFYPAQIESGKDRELIESSFDSFVRYYEECGSVSGQSSCACKINGESYFDLGVFPEDYYIKLESKGADVLIRLYKEDSMRMERVVKNEKLERYKYPSGCKELGKNERIELNSKKSSDFYGEDKKVRLFWDYSGKNACFVEKDKDSLDFVNKIPGCS